AEIRGKCQFTALLQFPTRYPFVSASGRGRVKTPLLPENGRAQHNFRRLAHLRSARMLENSTVIGMTKHSPEFSHGQDPLRKFEGDGRATSLDPSSTSNTDDLSRVVITLPSREKC